MLKYTDTMVTFSEFPDEISLCINISNCPCKCPGCHSSYLADDIGEILDTTSLKTLIDNNEGITCLGFMGGDNSPKEISDLAKYVKNNYDIRVGWYSGRQELSPDINLKYFDYYKLGPYVEEFGPLNNPKTNQRFFARGSLLHKMDANPIVFYDITDKF